MWSGQPSWFSDPGALAEARRELASQVDQVRFAQFLLLRQADQLKEHAHAKGVNLIGDLPFFVSPDSSDVWANPNYSCSMSSVGTLRRRGSSRLFQRAGAVVGQPVYNWILRSTGYRWCIDRLRALLVSRCNSLDHFRGFAAAWHVPARAPTAHPGNGCRVRAQLFQAVQQSWDTYGLLRKIWV